MKLLDSFVKTVYKNCEGIFVSCEGFKQKILNYAPKAKIAVVDPENTLTTFLKKENIEFVPFSTYLDKHIPVFVGKAIKNNTRYNEQVEEVRAHVKAGGYAVFLEVMGKKVPGFSRKLKEVETDALPFGAELQQKWTTRGGWAAKSHVVTKHPVFNGLPTEIIMHGVYENIHPVVSMSKQKGTYIAGMIGYDHFPNNEIMVRHYNGPGEVWWAADVLETPFGEGAMLLSTLRVVEYLGADPVAEKILYNMMDFAAKRK